MKFAIIGAGSMGKRRIRCLLANGIKPDAIRIVDVREDRRAEAKEKYGVEGAVGLEDALKWNPDAVIVSVPGAPHGALPDCRRGEEAHLLRGSAGAGIAGYRSARHDGRAE